MLRAHLAAGATAGLLRTAAQPQERVGTGCPGRQTRADVNNYETYDGVGLAELVATKEVTALEVVDAAIARVEALNPKLNAIVHTSFDRARARARAHDPAASDAPLGGVPFLLKDLMGQDAGQPSTMSNRSLRDWVATEDAELVARFKRSGLTIIGRTNTPEFGLYGHTEPELRGPCRNPWNLNHTPGGSSGGAASAVAAGIVPIAHAGDGGGSIRIPASHCGLVGLKPTRARNPAGPFGGERWAGFVSEGVVTRTVRDTAAVLDATHGPDVGAPYQVLAPEHTFGEAVGKDPGKLRIAVTTDALFGREMDPDCVAAVEAAAKLAESLGHEVEIAAPRFDRDALVKAYLTVVATSTNLTTRTIGEHLGRPARATDMERTSWLLKLIGDKITAGEYAAQLALIHRASRDVGQFFERYDVLLTATAARPPVRIGEFATTTSQRLLMRALSAAPSKRVLLKVLDVMASDALSATPNTQLFNMTGQPAISLPLALSRDRLPVGTQWVGRFGAEATLLGLASQLEQAAPWHDHRPPSLGS